MLFLDRLKIAVGNKMIIDDFTYQFEKGKTYVIMGPNGSGKSTLAFGIMGHPDYKITQGRIIFNQVDMTNRSADKRARAGLFISFQSPLSLSGVNNFQLLKAAMGKKIEPVSLKKKLEKKAKELNLKEELITRSLNEGASGGEKKKNEVIQAAILDPKLIIFDEIDTGVDIDALKTIAQFLNRNKKNKTYIIITHYNRILKYIKPDRVLILNNGRLVKEGDYRLAEEVESKGYKISNNK